LDLDQVFVKACLDQAEPSELTNEDELFLCAQNTLAVCDVALSPHPAGDQDPLAAALSFLFLNVVQYYLNSCLARDLSFSAACGGVFDSDLWRSELEIHIAISEVLSRSGSFEPTLSQRVRTLAFNGGAGSIVRLMNA
jgi:hypothetical protein